MGQEVRWSFPLLLLGGALSCNSVRSTDSHRDSREPEGTVAACATDVLQRLPELPEKMGGFCLPPAADVRRFGMGRENGLSGICDELFADQCEFYKTLGLRSVALTTLRGETSGRRELRVLVLDFEDALGAFGFVEARAVGGEEHRRLTVSGARAYLSGRALRLWRGRRALEVTYLSEDQTGAEASRAALEILPKVAEKAASVLDGAAPEPYEIRFFEQAEGLTSVRPARLVSSALGVSQSGPGATADLKDEGGEYRALVFARLDEPSAKDLLRTIQSGLRAPPLGKKTGILKARRLRADAEPESWYFTRAGRVVLGVGPIPEGGVSASGDRPRSLMETRLEGLARRARAFPAPRVREARL